MPDAPNPTPAPDATGGAPNPTPQGEPADKPLGPNGERALAAEREARKNLEQTVAQLQQAQKDQMAAIASALGVKTDAKADGTELLGTLQKQVAEMQHEALVYRVAAAHGLTESEDVNFLKASRDEATMTALAKRLAAKAAADDKPGTPKPDLTQGGKGDDPKPEVKPGIGRLRAAYANTQTK
jgi:hypothetical protein